MAKKPQTALELLDTIPPFLVRALATISGRGINTKRIPVKVLAERSGIPVRTIEALSYKSSWKGVKAGTMSAFADGCGVDLIRRKWRTRKLHMKAILKDNFSHLTKRQRKLLDTLAAQWGKK